LPGQIPPLPDHGNSLPGARGAGHDLIKQQGKIKTWHNTNLLAQQPEGQKRPKGEIPVPNAAKQRENEGRSEKSLKENAPRREENTHQRREKGRAGSL
ncbi:MAG: hypothetical protein LWW81_09825, partial [Rhodocyclales bacterium]|nr:hypothetical protein [Rhodocyclales bacterium]